MLQCLTRPGHRIPKKDGINQQKKTQELWMPGEQKSMNQLTAELAALRQRLADLETQLVTQPGGAVPVELVAEPPFEPGFSQFG